MSWFGAIRMKQPLIVCYGVGVDSTALLVGFYQRGIVPDLILFSDVGSEREATYEFIPLMNVWLASVGFPAITIVRYTPTDFKHWPPYRTLEENCLTNFTLPSLAYGFHTCSAKWKVAVMLKYVETWQPAIDWWKTGGKVAKCIGFEASPHELKRSQRNCDTFAVDKKGEAKRYELRFPLQEWGWDRERCQKEIASVGLHVPPKSSCFFCPAMKPWEVNELTEDKLRRIVVMEARARQRHLDHAASRNWPKGEGVPLTDGLWRKPVKGMRGAIPKPGSITEYIRQKKLLPSEEIDRIIAATPTGSLSQADFEAMGVKDWDEWIRNIIYAPAKVCT